MWLALLAGCVPAHETWPPVNPDQIADVLAHPTADIADARAFAESLTQAIDDLAAAGEAGEQVIVEIDRIDEAPEDWQPLEEDPAVVAAYLRIACPGPTEGPDPEFRYGEVRVEGPSLLADDSGAITPHGHLLFDLRACEREDLTLEGLLPAYWSATERLLYTNGTLRLTGPRGSARVPVLASWQEVWRFRLLTGAGRYAVVELDRQAPGSALLNLSDGTVSCTRETTWTCEWP